MKKYPRIVPPMQPPKSNPTGVLTWLAHAARQPGWLLPVLLMAVLLLPGFQAPVWAQTSVTWYDPIRLSNPAYMSWAPTLAVDSTGVVHILWSMSTREGVPSEGDTILYTRWDGQNWDQPIDVMVSPEQLMGAENPDTDITPDGTLHLVWSSGGEGAQLFYARAPSCCAEDVSRWSAPLSLIGPIMGPPAIIADHQGRIHIAVGNRLTGNLSYIQSADAGKEFLKPVSIPNGARQKDEYAIYPRMSIDDLGRIHMVWCNLPWPGRSVMYSRSDDGGKTWLQPQLIDTYTRAGYRNSDYGPIYIDVRTIGENEVHLIWDGAPTVERNHIFSMDGGKTWSSPDILFPEVTGAGRSGWNEMAIDSAGTLHAVSILGPLHSSWTGREWTPSDDIALKNYSGVGELMRIKIGLGNELNVVWLDKEQAKFSVWYVRGISDAPSTAPKSLPTFAPSPTPNGRESTQTPTVQLAPVLDSENRRVQRSQENPAAPILIGIVPATFAIGLYIWFLKKKK